MSPHPRNTVGTVDCNSESDLLFLPLVCPMGPWPVALLSDPSCTSICCSCPWPSSYSLSTQGIPKAHSHNPMQPHRNFHIFLLEVKVKCTSGWARLWYADTDLVCKFILMPNPPTLYCPPTLSHTSYPSASINSLLLKETRRSNRPHTLPASL